MRLTLHVPGLLLPREILSDTVFDLHAPALSCLLGRGQRLPVAATWLEDSFGIAGLPAAALRKVGADGTAGSLPACEWLCLDPVHFDVRREGIILADPIRLHLTAAEAAELIAAIQPLFAAWGELSASAPGRWELRLDRPLTLATQALVEAIDRPVPPGLPGGADGREWRRRLAEAQTVLHAHPLNRRRESAGQPTVSSLWPWGQGSLPGSARTVFDTVWSDDPTIAGLCKVAEVACQPLPERFRPTAGAVLAIQPALRHPATARDALAWRTALLNLDRDWLAPALAALKQGDCAEVRLIASSVDDGTRTITLTLTRGRLWRFWRRPRPLTALA